MCNVINRYDLTNLLRYIRPRNIQIYQDAFIHRSAVKKIKKTMRHLCCTIKRTS